MTGGAWLILIPKSYPAVTFVDDSFVSDLLRLRCLTLNLLTTWHDGFFILDEGTGSSQRGVLGDTFGEKTTSLMHWHDWTLIHVLLHQSWRIVLHKSRRQSGEKWTRHDHCNVSTSRIWQWLTDRSSRAACSERASMQRTYYLHPADIKKNLELEGGAALCKVPQLDNNLIYQLQKTIPRYVFYACKYMKSLFMLRLSSC